MSASSASQIDVLCNVEAYLTQRCRGDEALSRSYLELFRSSSSCLRGGGASALGYGSNPYDPSNVREDLAATATIVGNRDGEGLVLREGCPYKGSQDEQEDEVKVTPALEEEKDSSDAPDLEEEVGQDGSSDTPGADHKQEELNLGLRRRLNQTSKESKPATSQASSWTVEKLGDSNKEVTTSHQDGTFAEEKKEDARPQNETAPNAWTAGASGQSNPIYLFGAMPPKSLREAQKQSTEALRHYVALAALVQQIASVTKDNSQQSQSKPTLEEETKHDS